MALAFENPYRSNLIERAALLEGRGSINDVLLVKGVKDEERHHVTNRTEDKHRKRRQLVIELVHQCADRGRGEVEGGGVRSGFGG